jgi:hypothetical protein
MIYNPPETASSGLRRASGAERRRLKTVDYVVCVLGPKKRRGSRTRKATFRVCMKISPKTDHTGVRRWRDRFDMRRLADRLDEKLGWRESSAEDRTVTER